ncbi:Ribonuclease HII [Dissostichus eleginoides]|uniref:Ribonuclease HII n=1 Tax=Dissostichus eleginoides TaxID=100907 RepID=A0AAD9BAC1_DISEL|nr:Ribonuclease HII [Dissostichus eleginoides]
MLLRTTLRGTPTWFSPTCEWLVRCVADLGLTLWSNAASWCPFGIKSAFLWELFDEFASKEPLQFKLTSLMDGWMDVASRAVILPQEERLCPKTALDKRTENYGSDSEWRTFLKIAAILRLIASCPSRFHMTSRVSGSPSSWK